MIILVGPSASGKTEVAKLLEGFYQMKKVITHTTRPKRIHEVDGVDYHFVSKETFLKLKAEGAFVETTFYHDNYYGTSYKEVGDNKVVILDPNGLQAFKKIHDPHLVSFYFECSDEIRYSRMLVRNDKPETAMERIKLDKINFSPVHIKDEDIDFYIDSDALNLHQMAKYVYKSYQTVLKILKQFPKHQSSDI
ncbi:MAG: guanylate kinase [Erysipelotrichaceae bacterium]|jgi:guanylate kinase|nr:guanylate kinase [Erysipelotrichaceae bacterium]